MELKRKHKINQTCQRQPGCRLTTTNCSSTSRSWNFTLGIIEPKTFEWKGHVHFFPRGSDQSKSNSNKYSLQAQALIKSPHMNLDRGIWRWRWRCKFRRDRWFDSWLWCLPQLMYVSIGQNPGDGWALVHECSSMFYQNKLFWHTPCDNEWNHDFQIKSQWLNLKSK